jgi:hypothetical protein
LPKQRRNNQVEEQISRQGAKPQIKKARKLLIRWNADAATPAVKEKRDRSDSLFAAFLLCAFAAWRENFRLPESRGCAGDSSPSTESTSGAYSVTARRALVEIEMARSRMSTIGRLISVRSRSRY